MKNNTVFAPTGAVKPSLFLPLMILQNALIRVANVMSYYWTLVKPLTKFPTLVYVISYFIMEFMVHSYPGFKPIYITDPST